MFDRNLIYIVFLSNNKYYMYCRVYERVQGNLIVEYLCERVDVYIEQDVYNIFFGV